MKRHKKHPHLIVRNPAYRQAFQRLEDSLARTSEDSNFEKIDLLRLALFGVVAEPQQSGTVKIPK